MDTAVRTGRLSAARTAVCFVALSLVLAACSSEEGGGDAGSPGDGCEGETVTIAQSAPSFIHFPLYVMLGAEMLESAGLSSEVTDVGGGAEVVSAAVSGSVDVASATFGSQLRAVQAGAPIKSVASTEDLHGLHFVVKQSVLDEAGITSEAAGIEDLGVLEGLRIGISSPGSGSDALSRLLLQLGGFDPDRDAQIVALGDSAAMLAAFQQDELNALAVSAPVSYVAIEQAEGAFLFNFPRGDLPQFGDLQYMTYFSGERAIDGRADVLQCFVDAHAKALEMMQDEPEAALEAARSFMDNVEDDALYEEIANDYLASFPASPVLQQDKVERAIEMEKSLEGAEPITIGFDDIVDNTFAERAGGGQ
ncbi:MAG: hypothetical protein GEV12_00445 [Micromonosporaceae bacterium]|nr:hypothetical protein [Micromonosporaceae bacterium]